MASGKEGKKRGVGFIRLMISFAVLLVLGVAWALLYTGQVRAVEVTSGSMEPTIAIGDRLLVTLLDGRAPLYGQVVALKSPDDNGPDLVKRVVGVPGDKIELRKGILYRNGQLESPPAPGENWHPGAKDFEILLAPNKFFVAGDNRPKSHDSTEFGAVDGSMIYGIVTYRYSPWNQRGRIE
ncbi:signal peptidase I [bacterium]|nr:signal peptidase I [bacterium]